jgi:DNA-binding transcriptional MerR regulator
MFSIGEFARHGRVSVRMLRHYDAIGLIRPACVDVATGYRFYEASQLDELNRVIALKDLGFTLQQVQAILEEKVSAAELRGMLKLRRAEIQASIEAETTRLARVEARLLTIEDGARVPADGVVVKRLAPVRVAELTGVAAGYEPEAITPVIQPLYHDVWCRLASADIPAAGPAVAYYEDDVIDMARELEMEAGVPVATAVGGDGQMVTGVLPAGRYATLTHVGHPSELMAATKALLDWAAGQGLTWDVTPGEDGDRWACRLENYLTDPDQEPDMSKWVTQLAFKLAD